MADDQVPPPRYTSTPLAGRKTSNALSNFIEVSPIYSTPDRAKKTKSMIPILATNEIRSTKGCRSIGTKTKASITSTNGSGQGSSSGSVKIPSQIKKLDAEKKTLNGVQASKKSAPEVLPPKPKTLEVLPPKPKTETQSSQRNTIDKAIESVILALSQKETSPSQKESKTSSFELQIEAIVTKGPRRTQVLPTVPEEKPQSAIQAKVPIQDPSQTKSLPQVSKAVPEKEPRSSVDEVIDCVVKSFAQKETKTSPQELNTQDTGQLSEDGILKRTKAQSGWTIPKETKTQVSLKRKSSVPKTVTKRNKKTEIKSSQDNESLFDSPEVPNLVEVSSLSKNRKTYVLKKKSVIPAIQEEECHESVTDGIIPLEVLRQKSPSNNVNDSSKKGNSSRKNNEQSASKIKVEGEKENVEYNSPNFINQTKKTNTNKSEIHSKECVNIQSSSSTESASKKSIKSTGKGTKPTEPMKERDPGQSSKEQEVDTNTRQSKESKKKNIKSKKIETNQNQEKNTEETGIRRTLRERKPNAQYIDTDTSEIKNGRQKTDSKKKTVTTRANQEQKENLCEPTIEKKSQNKKGVKGNTKSSNVNSDTNKLLAQHHSKRPEKTDGANDLSAPKDLNLEMCSQNQEENNVSKKSKNTGQSKKDTGNKNKTKKSTKTNSGIPVEGEGNQIKSANFIQDVCSHQSTSKEVVGKSATTGSQGKNHPKNQNSEKNESEEEEKESQNADAFTDNENLVLVLDESSPLKSTSDRSEKQNSRQTAVVNNENQQVKPTEEDKGGNNLSAKGKSTIQVPEENEKVKRKTIRPTSKRSTISKSRTKSKFSDACEQIMNDKVNLPDSAKGHRESKSNVTLVRKRRSEEMEIDNTHSAPSTKKLKYDGTRSGRATNEERGFRIPNLLGMQELETHQVQPGVVNAPSIHINGFMMMGEVQFEPGATLSKITSNTAYTLQEGSAQVTILNKTKHFKASDKERRFFIPKNFKVSITNDGDVPLKMDFVKFKG